MKKDKHLDPVINQAVNASFKDGKLLEDQVHKLMKTFNKLTRTDVIYLVSGYLKGLKREVAKHTIVVESAVPLSDNQLNQIKRNLTAQYILTATHATQNPNILGGIKVRIADTVYDLSLKAKLQQVKGVIKS